METDLSARDLHVVDVPKAGSVRSDRRRIGAVEVAATLVVGSVLLRSLLGSTLDAPVVQNWTTIFVAVCVQALPFLVLGVAVSSSIAAFVPSALLARLVPSRPVASVPAAAAAGMFLPGCECGSVPIAARLASAGVPDAAALTFLLAAPAVNPVVLVATSVAFRGRPEMVLARFAASLIAAMTVGWIWSRRQGEPLVRRRGAELAGVSRRETLAHAIEHDFLQAGGFLVLGAALAATLQTAVPRSVLDAVADAGPLSVLALGLLAVLLAVCSEADAFVAAGLAQFSPTARLVFMTVGPMVDVKLVAMQAGAFGRSFALRFAPLTFAVCVLSGSLVGWVMW